MFRAAAYLGVAAVGSLVGIIHSPLTPAVIGWPWDVYATMVEKMPQTPEIQPRSLPIALSLGGRILACRRGGHADRLDVATG